MKMIMVVAAMCVLGVTSCGQLTNKSVDQQEAPEQQKFHTTCVDQNKCSIHKEAMEMIRQEYLKKGYVETKTETGETRWLSK